MINEISLSLKPKIDPACTSQAQKWGKGNVKNLNPGSLGDTDYGASRPDGRFKDIDPRANKTTKGEVDWFVSR